jgi:hypothetical protein
MALYQSGWVSSNISYPHTLSTNECHAFLEALDVKNIFIALHVLLRLQIDVAESMWLQITVRASGEMSCILGFAEIFNGSDFYTRTVECFVFSEKYFFNI